MLIELALSHEAGGVRLLTALHERRGDGRPGRTSEFFKFRAAGGEIEGGGSIVDEVLFPCRQGGGCAGELGGRCQLLTLAQLAGELYDDEHSKLLLRLRGAQLAGEERRVLRLTCFDEAATNGLRAMTGRPWLRGVVQRSLLTRQNFFSIPGYAIN